MRAILRYDSALFGRTLLGISVFVLLTPPLGTRFYLEAQAQLRLDAARHLLVVERPAGVRARPAGVRPYAVPLTRSALEGIQGKGGWFMLFNGDWSDPDADRAAALVDSAVAADLSHIYVRIADSRRHFYGAPLLQDLLPIAHSHGLRVIGWIEPLLDDTRSDALDAIAAARFQEDGQRLDGLALTIEGDATSDPNVGNYLAGIRSGAAGVKGVGTAYLLIASTYPTPADHRGYAYATLSRYCQVFAPMAYWRATGLPQFTGADGVRAYLDAIFQQFKDPAVNPDNRPLSITAQAYDAALEYGIPGSPPAEELVASMDETRARGGVSWSFYRLAGSHNGVTGDEAAAITSYPYWRRPSGPVIPTKPLLASPDQPVAY